MQELEPRLSIAYTTLLSRLTVVRRKEPRMTLQTPRYSSNERSHPAIYFRWDQLTTLQRDKEMRRTTQASNVLYYQYASTRLQHLTSTMNDP